MLNIGPLELILILLVALIFVGPKKLPELGRTIGKSLRELRKAQDEVRGTFNLLDEPRRATRATPARRTGAADRPATAGSDRVEPDRDDVPSEDGEGPASAPPEGTAPPPPSGDGDGDADRPDVAG